MDLTYGEWPRFETPGGNEINLILLQHHPQKPN
jgi:hypothetical protein